MAQGSSILQDDSLLSQIDQKLFSIERVFAAVAGLVAFSLMLLAVVSVGGRNIFNQPLPGYVDWIEQAMPFIALLAIYYTQRFGDHVRMDIVLGFVKGRAYWLLEFITVALILILIFLLIWGSWSHFLRSFDFSAPLWSRDSSMDIRLPLWPGKLIIPIAFSILALRLMVQLVGYGRAFWFGLENPVAVPRAETAEDIARQEADSLSLSGEAGNANGQH